MISGTCSKAFVLSCMTVLCWGTAVHGILNSQQATHLSRRMTEVRRKIDQVYELVVNNQQSFTLMARQGLPTIAPAVFMTTPATTRSVSGSNKTVCRVSSYSSFHGVCYKDFAQKKTYDLASERCAADGGLLAMPTDSETNTFIANLRDETQHRWFGMTDRISEGQWVFEDGQNLAMTGYSNWNPGEPNNKKRQQHCAGFVLGKSTWDDMKCSNTKGFICQIDPGTHILRIRTSDVKHSLSNNALAVEILSETCNGVCTTTTVSGLKARGFADPMGLRLRALGRDWLKIDWVGRS
ncbi:Multivesicular body subunit 12B [Branchiostoma belcheri]|nr:Multivesicular body subunit 12B [Branchiostoma belcheri]